MNEGLQKRNERNENKALSNEDPFLENLATEQAKTCFTVFEKSNVLGAINTLFINVNIHIFL